MSGYYCEHGLIRGMCDACERADPVKAQERRDDAMRQTLIDLTAAFNRMAAAVERACGREATSVPRWL